MNRLVCEDVICPKFEIHPKKSGREPKMKKIVILSSVYQFIKITRFMMTRMKKAQKPKKTIKSNKTQKKTLG